MYVNNIIVIVIIYKNCEKTEVERLYLYLFAIFSDNISKTKYNPRNGYEVALYEKSLYFYLLTVKFNEKLLKCRLVTNEYFEYVNIVNFHSLINHS